MLSSQIEGTQSSLDDLLVHELGEVPGVPMSDVTEVSRYVEAMTHGLQRLRDGFPLSNRLLREMHGILLAEGRGAQKTPGEFRRSQNWIAGSRPGNATFVPPPPQEVERCMGDLERFLHGDVPALVKAALAHVQFETIHPFLDGNGRIGRLLITLLLCNDSVLHEPLLYSSLYFKQHRQQYYAELNAVRETGDFERWLEFFATAIRVSAERAVETGQRILGVFQEDRIRLRGLGRQAPTALLIQEALQGKPLSTIAALTQATGLTVPTVTQAVRELVRLGIVRETTGRARGKMFAYTRYLEELSAESAAPRFSVAIEEGKSSTRSRLDGMVLAIREDVEVLREVLGPVLSSAATDEQIVAGALGSEPPRIKHNLQAAFVEAERITAASGTETPMDSERKDLDELNRLLQELKDRLDVPLRTYQANLASSAAKATIDAFEENRKVIGSIHQPQQSGMFMTVSAYLALITQQPRFRDFLILVVTDHRAAAEQYYDRFKMTPPVRDRDVFRFTSTNITSTARGSRAAIGVGTLQALRFGATAVPLPRQTLVIAIGFDLSSRSAAFDLRDVYMISFSSAVRDVISSQAPLIASYSFPQAVQDGYLIPAELVQVRLPGFEQLDRKHMALTELFPGSGGDISAVLSHDLFLSQIHAVAEQIVEHLANSAGDDTRALVIASSISQVEEFRQALVDRVGKMRAKDSKLRDLTVVAFTSQHEGADLRPFLDRESKAGILVCAKMWTQIDLHSVDRVYVACVLSAGELRTLIEKLSGTRPGRRVPTIVDYADNRFSGLYQ